MKTKTYAAAAVATEMLVRETQGLPSFGPEDDYVMGFLAGQANAEMREQMFGEALEELINIASKRGEFHSVAYARYIMKRVGYDYKKRTK